MALVNGATYRFQNRADPNRSLNVYGNSPAYLANVCLYTNNSNDICQQWVYREVGSHAYLECKGDPDLVLDLYTGSDSVAYENNYNAHVFNDVTSTCYIEILDASDDDPDYIQIKLEDYTNKYLTANQGSNGTAAGRGVNSNGNVYFYNGGLTDLSQDWKPIRLDGGTDPEPEPEEEVTVTGMPSCWAYSGGKEYFHPLCGMVPGDFMEDNDGMAILTKIHDFYETVFKTTLEYEDNEEDNAVDSRVNMDKYGYSLFGSRTVTNDNFNGTYHLGVDMTMYHNAPIYSAHAGELLRASGNRIAIYDPYEEVTYLYLHTNIDNSISGCGSDFDEPMDIEVGQPLGTQSDVGLGNGNYHLHFEVKAGRDSSTEMPTNELTDDVIGLYKCPYDYM